MDTESTAAARETLLVAAREFLKAIAELAKAEIGSHPKRVQQSAWSGGGGHRRFERTVFDGLAVRDVYWQKMQIGFPEQQALEDILVALGIPVEDARNHFMVPLVYNWAGTPDPFALKRASVSPLLEEFATAVIEGRVQVRSRDVIDSNRIDSFDSFELVGGPLQLDDRVCIRPITNEELWEFGEGDRFRHLWPRGHSSSEKSNILDIKVETVDYDDEILFEVQTAVVTALQLARPGCFQLAPRGQTCNYGYAAQGVKMPMECQVFGRWGGSYVLDARTKELLVSSWPRVRQIMESNDHYLKMPAQRLVEAGTRRSGGDAIIDCAIGLEALLTAGVRDELRYRFALRGAAILAWERGHRREHFYRLQEFYDTRSAIVHSGGPSKTKVGDALATGEQTLRDAWWWHFRTGATNVKEAISLIDDRILD